MLYYINMDEENAGYLARAIIADYNGRGGLDHQWDSAGDEIQTEIRLLWTGIIAREANSEKAVDAIMSDLNGRRGMGFDSIDDEIENEIRSSWIAIINGQEEVVQAVKDNLGREMEENPYLIYDEDELREFTLNNVVRVARGKILRRLKDAES